MFCILLSFFLQPIGRGCLFHLPHFQLQNWQSSKSLKDAIFVTFPSVIWKSWATPLIIYNRTDSSHCPSFFPCYSAPLFRVQQLSGFSLPIEEAWCLACSNLAVVSWETIAQQISSTYLRKVRDQNCFKDIVCYTCLGFNLFKSHICILWVTNVLLFLIYLYFNFLPYLLTCWTSQTSCGQKWRVSMCHASLGRQEHNRTSLGLLSPIMEMLHASMKNVRRVRCGTWGSVLMRGPLKGPMNLCITPST